MRKKFVVSVITFFFFSPFFTLVAQNRSYIDSMNDISFTQIVNDLRGKLPLFQKCYNQAKKIGYKRGQAESLERIGLIYSYLNNYEASVDAYTKSATLFDQLKDTIAYAGTESELGFVMRKIDKSLALKSFRKSIALIRDKRPILSFAKIYDNYGNLLQDDKVDSAIYYYQFALRIKKRFSDKIGIPFSLNKLATAYSQKKDYPLAFKQLNEAYAYVFSAKDKNGIADNLAYRADVFYDMKARDSAIYYYEKSLKLAKEVQFLSLMRFCYDRLTQLYEQKGKYSAALDALKRLKSHDDSVLNAETRSKMATLEIEFETAKKEREIAQQKLINLNQSKINSENELKLEKRRRWLIAAVFGVLLIGFIFLFVYRAQRSKRISERNELELKNQLEKSELDKKFAEEKLTISRELHDNIGSHLTFIISSVDNLAYQETVEEKKERLATIGQFGRTTMKDLRATIWAMKNDGGNLEDLMVKLHELKQMVGGSLHFSFKVNAPNSLQFNALQLLNIYRVIQEALQNCIKYAGATEFNLAFNFENDLLKITCSDNGKGFNIIATSNGYGLMHLRHRMEEIKGDFTIESELEKGTILTFTIPIQNARTT